MWETNLITIEDKIRFQLMSKTFQYAGALCKVQLSHGTKKVQPRKRFKVMMTTNFQYARTLCQSSAVTPDKKSPAKRTSYLRTQLFMVKRGDASIWAPYTSTLPPPPIPHPPKISIMTKLECFLKNCVLSFWKRGK